MLAPSTLMPVELIAADKQADVVRYILAQPWTGHFKRLALLGWSVTVGVKIDNTTYAQVEASGVKPTKL
jgi:hypothetical protein